MIKPQFDPSKHH